MDYKQIDMIKDIIGMNTRCLNCHEKIAETNIGAVLLKEQAVLCIKCKDMPKWDL